MDKDFLYEQVAHNVLSLIQEQTLRPGDKLPSLREMSRTRNVSIATVTQAYFFLEAKGVVQVRPQSGYYVSHPSPSLPEPDFLSGSQTLTDSGLDTFISEILESVRKPGTVPLGIASVSSELLPTHRLYQMLAQLARETTTNTYGQPQGEDNLRRQIALRTLDSGQPLSADELLVTCGCMEALSLALRAVADSGDTIVVESPTYYGILQLIEGLGMKALEIPAHPRDGLSLAHLEIALKRYPIKACLTIPTFHNPLGACMPPDHKQYLVNLLTSRGIPIIEDDIYGELYFDYPPPPTLRALAHNDLVILCSSFSKTLSPGLRVGWMAPGRYFETCLKLKRTTTLSTATFPQWTVARFLEKGLYERHLRSLRKKLAHNVNQMAQAIAAYFPPGTRLSRPQGGFVLWVELPEGKQAIKLYQQALKYGISLAPGPLFSGSGEFSRFCRLNAGLPWSDKVDKALFLLGSLLKEK